MYENLKACFYVMHRSKKNDHEIRKYIRLNNLKNENLWDKAKVIFAGTFIALDRCSC